MFQILFILISLITEIAVSHFCGDNKIPYGIEIYRNGQPALLCSRPTCFEKVYSDCDERATRRSCNSNTSWVGGLDKSYGNSQPLYVQCCEFEMLPLLSEPLYSNVIIRPGEYFEGEEIMDKINEEMISFDLITNLKKVGGHGNSSIAYIIDIRRLKCNEMARPKRYKPWNWP